MPRNELGGLRRSQAVSTHAPGAIVDFRPPTGGSVSGVATGLDAWDERSFKKGLAHDQRVFEARLERELGVKGFRLPPVAPQQRPGVVRKNADVLLAVRFPSWLQCPHCHVLKPASSWNGREGDPALFCQSCTDENGVRQRAYVVPARFIRSCDHGHLDEFPWDLWVGHDLGCSRRKKGLRLKSGGGAGLEALVLECLECEAKRSMDGCFSSPDVKKLGCGGYRHWLGDSETCEAHDVHVLQRGASNIYFAVTLSALDIPPWSDPLQVKLQQGHDWHKLLGLPPEKRATYVELVDLPKSVGANAETILERVDLFLKRESSGSAERIRWEEYQQLIKPYVPFGEGEHFETRHQHIEPRIAAYFSRLVAVTRLREVRAFTGFTRIQPPAGRKDKRIAKIAREPKDWLPAIEVRGEGIFLEFSAHAVRDWIDRAPEVKERAARIDAQHQKNWEARGGAPEERHAVTPQFLLVHSLAHALIEQLALTCGYASASLRERLYVGESPNAMAGLLIYTASADADGTLGGLSRQARPSDFAATVARAIRGMEWCSSDPLCIEEKMALSHRMNAAACHACLLSAETSCEEFNYLLDRAMLVGTPENRDVGFFASLQESLHNEGL
jgi:hypothetical protein